jgi:acyl carrier protein
MEQQLQSPGMTLREAGIDENAIVELVNTVLVNTQVDPPRAEADMPLHALGLTSLDTAEVFIALEELAGSKLDSQPMSGVMTVRDLINLRCVPQR